MRRFGLFLASLLSLVVLAPQSRGQTADSRESQPVRLKWSASWISHPTAPLREPLTLHFRRSFTVAAPVPNFRIHVSADNRFVLYLNGARIGAGPARGDLDHWRYETFDLGPRLVAGQNTLSANVWNFGVYAPTAQITDRTALLVEGDTAAESEVNTDERWMVETEPGQFAYPRQARGFWAYMATGPGETLRAADYDWNWQTEPLVDAAHGSRWVAAASAIRESIYPSAAVAGSRGISTDNPWRLVPDTLPAMSYVEETAGKVVRTDLAGGSSFPSQSVTIPANAHVHILLDRSSLTTAYPQLEFSGGKDSHIELTYAEALFDEKQHKGDRDDVGTRKAFGAHDSVMPDGSVHRIFETLWWRTWRYLDLDIETASEPLRLDSLRAAYTAYPFEQRAHFTSSDPELDHIWNVGWHTLELDAHETYMDTPYYEQLQYVGDSRIEAMITYAVSGDDLLARQAIRTIDDSRRYDGLTASRAPSSLAQYIPPFSLLWIGMVRDFALYRPGQEFVRDRLPGVHSVLRWFAEHQQPNGLLDKLPDWSFVDWTASGQDLPSYDAKGQSCLLTLQYIGALKDAAELEEDPNHSPLALEYTSRQERAADGVRKLCWDAASGLIADSPAKNAFSQQANSLAVLYDVVPQAERPAVMKRVLDNAVLGGRSGPAPALIPASYYFDYYVARALDHADMDDRYFEILERWRELSRMHFSTWPEVPGDTRSDSHAWSAHPTYDLLTIVAGIVPASNGFASVTISPHLGNLQSLDAAMPHDRGIIHVHYLQQDGHLSALIDLPHDLPGVFHWKGHEVVLHAGSNAFELTP